MMPETVQGLRNRLARMVCDWQLQSAAVYAAADEEREGGNTQDAVWLQGIAARKHRAVEGGLDWLLDEPHLVEWCANINRAREEEYLKRSAEILRVDAMSPTERAEWDRKRLELRNMLDGLIKRDVR